MLRRIVLWSAAALIGLLFVIQLVPYGRDHDNPPVTAEPAWASAATRALAVTACFDCHSNQTVWPWYTNIAPMSWLAQRDVDQGREALNFSESGGEADEAAEAVREGAMPPPNYDLLHPDANLSDEERQALIDGLIATFGGEASEEAGEDE